MIKIPILKMFIHTGETLLERTNKQKKINNFFKKIYTSGKDCFKIILKLFLIVVHNNKTLPHYYNVFCFLLVINVHYTYYMRGKISDSQNSSHAQWILFIDIIINRLPFIESAHTLTNCKWIYSISNFCNADEFHYFWRM